mgnify:CR=1 FL=1
MLRENPSWHAEYVPSNDGALWAPNFHGAYTMYYTLPMSNEDDHSDTQSCIGMVTATGGVKVGTAATIHSTGQFNIGVAHTLFANGNATHSGIVTAASFKGDGSLLTGVAAGVWTETAVGVSTIKTAGINTTALKGTTAGAATSEGAAQIHGSVSVFDGFVMTDQQIDKHLTLPAGKNGLLIGPVTIATGIGMTVESGSTLLIA